CFRRNSALLCSNIRSRIISYTLSSSGSIGVTHASVWRGLRAYFAGEWRMTRWHVVRSDVRRSGGSPDIVLHDHLGWKGGHGGFHHGGTHYRGGLADPLLRASSEHFPKCAMREHGGLAGPPRRLRHSQAEAIFSDCRAHPLQYESNGSQVQREAREQKTTRHLLDNHLFVNST